MSPFFWGLLIGIFLGVNMAIIVVGLCLAAKWGDEI